MRARSPLPLPRLLEALDAWQRVRGEAQRAAAASALCDLVETVGLEGAALEIQVPPLADLSVACGSLTDAAASGGRQLRGADGVVLGRFLADPPDAGHAEAAAAAVAAAVAATRARVRAERAEANLAALDVAVRGIAGVLAVDGVLQEIVDRVRELVDARYAALGIVDANGRIERFITSGISAEQRRRIGPEPHGRGLLGLIVRENRSIRIPDIASDPRRYGFPPHHPEMHSFLGVPITVGSATIGRLYLTEKQGAAEFSEDDQRLVERFALHAGIAMENARLHERVQRLAVVEERERIGRDLHDGIIQRIYGVTLSLDDVPELVEPSNPEVASRVDRAIDALHATIGELRTFIFGLGPQLEQRESLLEALQALAAEVRANVPIKIAVHAVADPDVSADTASELISIAREALSNVARHAGATAASVNLSTPDGALRLEITDDGRGFDVAQQLPPEHRGLRNMEQRAGRMGGALSIESARGDGTRIIVELPLTAATAGGQ
jgi:signal transduction histidine kinase